MHVQNGVDLSLSPCFAKFWFLLAFGGHIKTGCDRDTFRAVFLFQHLGILRSPNTAKQGKTQNDESTLLYPTPHKTTPHHPPVHFLEILENLEILEVLENPQTVKNKGESDHFLEILENLEISEILEIPPVKRPLS